MSDCKVFTFIHKGQAVTTSDVAKIVMPASAPEPFLVAKRDLQVGDIVEFKQGGSDDLSLAYLQITRGDKPSHNGVYLAYVAPDLQVRFAKKILLTFVNDEWTYSGSDQRYRDKIFGYIGPLPAYEINT